MAIEDDPRLLKLEIRLTDEPMRAALFIEDAKATGRDPSRRGKQSGAVRASRKNEIKKFAVENCIPLSQPLKLYKAMEKAGRIASVPDPLDKKKQTQRYVTDAQGNYVGAPFTRPLPVRLKISLRRRTRNPPEVFRLASKTARVVPYE